jgi:hypothetical protein
MIFKGLKKEDRHCTKKLQFYILEAIYENKQQQVRVIMAGKKKPKQRAFKGTVHIFFHFFTHLSHVSSVRGKGGQECVG